VQTSRKRVVISVISGLLAAVLMVCYAYMVQKNAAQGRSQTLIAYGGEQVEVFVAMRNIAAGERLTPNNVSKQTWLVDLLPAGALTDESEVLGQTLGLPLLANEPVVEMKLASGADTLNIPEGYCAVSIPTNDVLAVGGAVTAGSVIAVYAADKDSVQLLAAEVLVLETSSDHLNDYDNSSMLGSGYSKTSLSWVTLIVTEDMVAEIISASRNMNLYLVIPGGEL